MTESQPAIGVDLGGSAIKAVLVDAEGEVLRRERAETREEDVIDTVAAVVESLDAKRAPVGLAAPGLAARDGRSIAWMRGRLDRIEGVDWTERLQRSVRVLNDAHAATLGEAWVGAAKGCRNVILLTLGTGVGGGAIVDGRLLEGALGRAGHLGHVSLAIDGQADIVGTPGSLEDAFGDATVATRSAGAFASTRELIASVREQDAKAKDVWERSVRALAAALASFINVLDPERIVLAGGIVESGDLLFEPLASWLDRWEWRPHGHRVEIVAARSGVEAGAMGAAWWSMGTPRL